MSIEGIVLEYFSAATKKDIKSSALSLKRHAVFHSFLSDNSKKDAATTTAHRKIDIIYQEKKIIDNIIKYNMGKH